MAFQLLGSHNGRDEMLASYCFLLQLSYANLDRNRSQGDFLLIAMEMDGRLVDSNHTGAMHDQAIAERILSLMIQVLIVLKSDNAFEKENVTTPEYAR